MERSLLRMLDLVGSPGEMGLAHGRAYAEEIRAYAGDEATLAGSPGGRGPWSRSVPAQTGTGGF